MPKGCYRHCDISQALIDAFEAKLNGVKEKDWSIVFVQENPKITSVYIGVGERSSVPVREMMKELEIDAVVLLDKYKQIGERHGVVIDGEVVLPRTFLVSSTGTLETIISVEGVDFEEVLRNELKRIEAQIQLSVGHE